MLKLLGKTKQQYQFKFISIPTYTGKLLKYYSSLSSPHFIKPCIQTHSYMHINSHWAKWPGHVLNSSCLHIICSEVVVIGIHTILTKSTILTKASEGCPTGGRQISHSIIMQSTHNIQQTPSPQLGSEPPSCQSCFLNSIPRSVLIFRLNISFIQAHFFLQ